MRYRKAPIREAVFDIRVSNLKLKKLQELEAIKEYLPEGFEQVRKRHNITGKFEVSGEQQIRSETQTKQTGFVFLNNEGTRHIQVRRDGLTLNILKPYLDWETHFECFIDLWKSYQQLFEPEIIDRVAVRFINKINLPIPFDGFQQYITSIPPIPENLPQTFAKFFMQIEVPCINEHSRAIITETFEDPEVDHKLLPFILDIDVSQENHLPDSFDELINLYNEFRKVKNQTFESCITDKTRELIS